MASADIRDRVDAIYNDATQLANARDYLNMLASSEGTAGRGDRGYNVMFRGDLINDYSRHPNMMHTYTDKNGKQGGSTAAGRYQFLYKTYNEMAKRLGITDFSPESQDKVAIALMLEKGVDFSDGADFGRNVAKINNVWTSLAGSSLGMQHHSVRSFQQNLDAFNQSRHSRGLSPVTSFWDKTTYQTDPASLTTGMSQADMQKMTAQANSYLESLGLPQGGFLGQALSNINNKIYAQPGAIPFQMYSGNKFTVSSDPNLTGQNVSAMAARLHNTDPNALYGVSVTSNGIVGTANLTQPAQTQPAPTVAPAPAPAQQGLPTAQPKTPVSGASNGGASTPQAPSTGAPQTMVYPKSEDYYTGETASGGIVRWDPATGNVNVAQPVVTQYRTGTPQSLAEVPNASGVSSVFAGMPVLQSTGNAPASSLTGVAPLNDYELEQKVLQLGNTNTVIPTSSGLPDANRTAVVPERQPVVPVPADGIIPAVTPTTQTGTGSGDVTVGTWVIPTGSNGIPQFQNTSVDALRDLLDQTQIKQRDLPTFRPVEL